MTPIVNPLVEGSGTGAPLVPGVSDEGTAAGGGVAGSSMLGAGFSSVDNTSKHVAILVFVALIVLILLHIGGFHFAVDTGVTRI